MFDKSINKLENIFIKVLIVAALIYISFEVLELFLKLFDAITNYDFEKSKTVEGYNAFDGFVHIFFNILIALEIVETLRIDSHSHIEKAKLILIIALIAISRKVIEFDYEHTSFEIILSIGTLIIVLSVGYFLLGYKKGKRNSLKKTK